MNKPYSIITGLPLAITLLAGCASTSGMKEINVDSLVPAEVVLPANIENLLIVDRTVYTGNPFESNEALLTKVAPGASATDSAAQNLIFYLSRYMGTSPRFQSVVANEALTGNSISKVFPTPIPWDTVKALCSKYQSDALVAIEVSDYDFSTSNPRASSSSQQAMSNDPQLSRYTAAGVGTVVFGFRVYYPETETIIDEEMFRHKETWEATGEYAEDAATNLIRREQAISELIHLAAAEYAQKIAPIYVPVPRKYFGESRNVPAMATGSQLAEEGKWQEAADTWEVAISQAPKREAGQLAYNVAIAYEALGKPEQAREWANKAQVEYGNGQAKEYLADLDGKKSLLDRAKEQLDVGGGVQMPGVEIQ